MELHYQKVKTSLYKVGQEENTKSKYYKVRYWNV